MTLPRITDYDLLEKLGVGSYSTVYKARHKKERSYHAIKIVEMSTLSDSSRENLITEIRLLRSLNHKYIVTLQDFFWDDKYEYIFFRVSFMSYNIISLERFTLCWSFVMLVICRPSYVRRNHYRRLPAAFFCVNWQLLCSICAQMISVISI